jgi:hypothetical protein
MANLGESLGGQFHIMKNAFGYPRVLAAFSSLASIIFMAGPAKAATIDYVKDYSSLFSNQIQYDSIGGLTQSLNSNQAGSPVTLTTLASTPSANVLGLTAASTSLGGTSFDPHNGLTGAASASAYSNLATGSIGAYATGSVAGGTISTGQAFAGAQIQDAVTFNNTSGHTVNIDVFWTFDGIAPVATGATSEDILFCLGAATSCVGVPSVGVQGPINAGQFFHWQDSLLLGLPSDPAITLPTAGWVSSVFLPGGNAASGTFHGVFAIPAGLSTDSLNAFFAISAAGATADYSHTGTLSFGGLNGVSFTSASGVLLTQTPAAVPEPGSWILMMAGLVLIGLAKWRKPHMRSV